MSDPGRNGGAAEGAPERRVSLGVSDGQDEAALTHWLDDEYTVVSVEAVTDPGGTDLYLFDLPTLRENRADIQRARNEALPAFLPVVLVTERSPESLDASVWDYADDIVPVPTTKRQLGARIGNLLGRRQASERLQEKERELQSLVDELSVKERAMDAASVGITIADATVGDEPLTYVNREFERITGYDAEEAIGQNCRFLQGTQTSDRLVAEIRAAVEREEPFAGTMINYAKSGRRFYNRLQIAPVRRDGQTTHFVGFQQDVTDEEIRRQRLEVMNRVFRHNIRNEMNVIQGYSDLIREGSTDERVAEMAGHVDDSAASLLSIADDIRTTEKILSVEDRPRRNTTVIELLQEVTAEATDAFPDAEVTVAAADPEAAAKTVQANGVREAFAELIRSSLEENDSETPVVRVSVAAETVRPGTVTVEVADNGRPIPENELQVLRSESETPLYHSDRLGVWKTKWIFNRAGGELELTNNGGSGSTVSVTLPCAELEGESPPGIDEPEA
jgi:PAS domain S-box-containing protein